MVWQPHRNVACSALDYFKVERLMFSKKLAALAALSMMTASTTAVAQSAASLSLSEAPVARAGAQLEDANDIRGGFIIPLVVITALIVGVILLTGGGDDESVSP
jgi:hypothetical protein